MAPLEDKKKTPSTTKSSTESDASNKDNNNSNTKDQTTNNNQIPTLGALEEDDEFEEFPAEDWTEADEDKEDLHAWEDNWDDDDIEDDFSNQLRIELTKRLSGPQPMAS